MMAVKKNGCQIRRKQNNIPKGYIKDSVNLNGIAQDDASCVIYLASAT